MLSCRRAGACAMCQSGFFRSNKLRAVPRELHKLWEEATYCLSCKENSYMSGFNQKCVRMADATRCLEMTPMGCAACTDGSFLSDGECFPCPDGCAVCIQSDRCDACSADRILNDWRCLGKGEVCDCAEVSGSRCTRCTGSLTDPNSDGMACQSWMFTVLSTSSPSGFSSFSPSSASPSSSHSTASSFPCE